MGLIEALHIYDEHNSLILTHVYTGRPISANHLLPLYLERPAPRPPLIYLPNTNPPTLVFSLTHGNLLLIVTSSTEIEPLLVIEFLHRVVDVFEDFLGAPLIAQKIESSYDIILQLLTEMCDAGIVNITEPNALRDLVEVEGFMGKLLGNLNLPTKPNFAGASVPALTQSPLHTGPALPWRRANVRHTSNELYADVIETLKVTLAPSGRPISAFANGTIAFTCKVSGVPDIVVTLTGPSGKHNLRDLIELPVFHPCVRLAKWSEQPGVLSFVPPDGRFTLAGYEVDLLPHFESGDLNLTAKSLKLPVTLEVNTCLGPSGADFEVRLTVNRAFFGAASGGSSSSGRLTGGGGSGGIGRGIGAMGGAAHSGTAASPLLQELTVTVPLPQDVRNLSEIRTSRGDATYNPGDRFLEWCISDKELSGGASIFTMRCTVVGQMADNGEDENADPTGFGFGKPDYSYDVESAYQSSAVSKGKSTEKMEKSGDERDALAKKIAAQNKLLMPNSASLSFTVRGWLASGVKVESIVIDPRKSRGLSETMKPYKGVKYLTVSKRGIEIRC
ncbi:hypothetical protein V8F06_003266 [Rhypophila decipiens]